MKRKIKILIDVIMTILFIILMGYFITDNKVHEVIRNNYICIIHFPSYFKYKMV